MPPDTSDDEKVLSRHEVVAAGTRLSRSLVFITPARTADQQAEVGSGTVIRTPGGYPLILTAWHVAEDAVSKPLNVGFLHGPSLQGAVLRAIEAPNGVDVGVLVPTPAAAHVLAQLALPSDVVAEAADTRTSSGELCMIGGFPKGFEVQRVDHAAKTVWTLFSSATYNCTILGIDGRGRYRVRWLEREMEAVIKPTAFDQFARDMDRVPRTLNHPGGMSGGGLWRFTAPKPKGVWSATVAGKIIGVQESWDKDDTVFCPSVAQWSDWFRQVCAEVDTNGIQ